MRPSSSSPKLGETRRGSMTAAEARPSSTHTTAGRTAAAGIPSASTPGRAGGAPSARSARFTGRVPRSPPNGPDDVDRPALDLLEDVADVAADDADRDHREPADREHGEHQRAPAGREPIVLPARPEAQDVAHLEQCEKQEQHPEPEPGVERDERERRDGVI